MPAVRHYRRAAGLAIAVVAGVLAMPARTTPALADFAPPIQMPWLTGAAYYINGGYSYGCGDHKLRDFDAIDFALPNNTAVVATAAGIAHPIAQNAYTDGYGNVVWVDHGGGLVSVYGHLGSFAVNDGQSVGQGQVIGYSDNTGNSSGPHLHFAMHTNTSYSDPLFTGTAFLPEPMSGYTGFGQWGACGSNPSPNYTSLAPFDESFAKAALAGGVNGTSTSYPELTMYRGSSQGSGADLGEAIAWNFTNLSGPVFNQPLVLASNADGRLEVFGLGSDGNIYDNYQITAGANNWHGWGSLGAGWHSRPWVGRNGTGLLVVFMRGDDSCIYYNVQPWSGWSSTGFGCGWPEVPVVIEDVHASLMAFARGGDGFLYDNELGGGGGTGWVQVGPGGGWSHQTAVVRTGTGSSSNVPHLLDAYEVGNDQMLYHNLQNTSGSWTGWSLVGSGGGWPGAQAGVAKNLNGDVEAFTRGGDGYVYHNIQLSPGGSWSGWSRLVFCNRNS